MWFLKFAMAIASSVTKWMADKQLIDAGKAQANLEIMEETLEKIRKANTAAADVTNDADSLQDDPNRR